MFYHYILQILQLEFRPFGHPQAVHKNSCRSCELPEGDQKVENPVAKFATVK